MTAQAAIQNRDIAKGFGAGLVLVLLAYGGLYGWISMHGPAVRAEREGQLASRTIVIERTTQTPPVAQISSAGELSAEAAGPPTREEFEKQHGEIAAVAHEDEAHVPSEGKEVQPRLSEEPAGPPVEDKPLSAETALLKDVEKYPHGMCVAPIEGLYEDTQDGRLPVSRQDGLSPFKAYRKPFVHKGDQPVISIAVSDMGLSPKITESAIKSLPPEITLVISPYADGPDMWTNEARTAGHEVWLSLPMETSDYPQADPGPHSLMAGAPEHENQQKLKWVMSRAVGYAGLIATYDPSFMSAQNEVRPILNNIYKRGIGFMDSGPYSGTLPETMALSMNAPYARIDVWIDKPSVTPEIINASLQQLELVAKESGYAAGIITPTSTGFRELQTWLATLKDKGFVLAPLSAQTGY